MVSVKTKRIAGALPERTRAILNDARIRSGAGGFSANAVGDISSIASNLASPTGAANFGLGFLRYGLPLQVAVDMAQHPEEVRKDPENAVWKAVLRSQTAAGLVENSPGWSRVAANSAGAVKDILTTPWWTPKGAMELGKKARGRLSSIAGGIGRGFYEQPVSSTLGMVLPFVAARGGNSTVHANDNAIIAYHGTPRPKASEIDIEHAVETPGTVFFTDNPDVADIFRYPREYGEVLFDEPAGTLFKADVNFTNPLKISGEDARLFTENTAYQGKIVKYAKEQGFDGIIVEGAREGVGQHTLPGTTYVSFGPNTYKILGTED